MIYRIKLTAQELEIIGRALDERPYKEVKALADNVQAQINTINEAAQAAEKGLD